MPFGNWLLEEDGTLTYLDNDEEDADPPYIPYVSYKLYDHTIYQYSHAWIACKYPDGSVEVSRMD